VHEEGRRREKERERERWEKARRGGKNRAGPDEETRGIWIGSRSIMMRNPFAINNGDLDRGDARERRDESSSSVKMEREDGRGDHWEGIRGKRFDVTSSEVGTYATEGTSGAAAASSCILYERWLSFLSRCHRKNVYFVRFDRWPMNSRYNLRFPLIWSENISRIDSMAECLDWFFPSKSFTVFN